MRVGMVPHVDLHWLARIRRHGGATDDTPILGRCCTGPCARSPLRLPTKPERRKRYSRPFSTRFFLSEIRRVLSQDIAAGNAALRGTMLAHQRSVERGARQWFAAFAGRQLFRGRNQKKSSSSAPAGVTHHDPGEIFRNLGNILIFSH